VAESHLALAETNIQRSVVRAPIVGTIPQVNIHVGEIAPVTPFINAQAGWQTAAQGSLLLMNAVDPM
jgi:multidrug resistance efflux pump